MADEPKTDGSASESTTTTQVAKPATDKGNDKPEAVPYERFQGVIAERERLKVEKKAAEEKLQQFTEAQKTEDQKKIDAAVKAIVEAEWKPKADQWAKRDASDQAELDALVQRIPEDHRRAVDSAATVYDKLQVAKTLVAILEKKGPALTTAASPAADKPSSTYTREQWDQFASLSRTDPKKYAEMKPEMFKAAYEGRVAGLRDGV